MNYSIAAMASRTSARYFLASGRIDGYLGIVEFLLEIGVSYSPYHDEIHGAPEEFGEVFQQIEIRVRALTRRKGIELYREIQVARTEVNLSPVADPKSSNRRT